MNRTTELMNLIERADQIYYYQPGRGGVSDETYGGWKTELKAIMGADWASMECLTRVGAPLSKDNHRKTVKHNRLIGSINDAMTEKAFRAWWPGPCSGSLKMDGLTVENIYKDGILITSATRGDGEEGEDVTANAIQMTGLPRYLFTTFNGEVRGEAYMAVKDFQEVNAILEEEGEDTYQNPRNAAAGILRSTDGRFSERLQFAAHGIHDESGGLCIANFRRAYDAMQLLGFNVVRNWYCETVEAAVTAYAAIESQRPDLGFWIDGTVWCLDDLPEYEALGITHKRPKGAVAWKFESEEAKTILREIVVTVGHSGKLTPTASFTPVNLGGASVTNAQLFNWELIAGLGIALEDQIIVCKQGDVIPGVSRLAKEMPGRKLIVAPTTCPICQGKVAKNLTSKGTPTVDLYCQNDDCPAKAIGKVGRWIKSLEIKEVGEAVLAEITKTRTYNPGADFLGDHPATMVEGTCHEFQLVTNPADLYRLRDLGPIGLGRLQVNGRTLGPKRAATILAEIDKTRTLSIDDFMGSLGVKGLGKRKSQLIREAWLAANRQSGYLPELLDEPRGWFTDPRFGSKLVELADQLGIPGIARSIQSEIDAKRPLIEALLKYITIKAPEAAAPVPTTGLLAARTFCLTGKFSSPKSAFHDKIKSLGGQVRDDLDNDVTDLVSADVSVASSKLKKARKKGLSIMDERGLVSLLAA